MNRKYPSKYSNGKEVSAAQYITEMICEKKARLSKLDLHYRFWLNKEWSAFFRNQIATANKLLKKYDELAVIRALSDPKAAKIFSLRAPHLAAIIDSEQLKIDNAPVVELPTISRVENSIGRKQITGKKTSIDKLRELDND